MSSLLGFLGLAPSSKVSPPQEFSYEVPGTANPQTGQGPTYRNPNFKKGPVMVIEDFPELVSSYDCFQKGVKDYPNAKCHGTRTISPDGSAGAFIWQTYAEIDQRLKNFGRGLMARDLIPLETGSGMRLLGLYMKNRSEWVIAEQGLFAFSGTTVPLYDTLGEETVEYVLNQTLVSSIVCTALEMPKLFEAKENCPAFTNIIFVCTPGITNTQIEDFKNKCKNKNINFYLFSDIEAEGSTSSLPLEPADGSKVATFCYTSGTTGDPKGARLTHKAIVCNVAAFADVFKINSPVLGHVSPSDVYLSYLPLAHVMERLIQIVIYFHGASVGFYQGDTLKILEDIKELRPTVFLSVPRLLNRIHDKISGGVNEAGGVKAWMFNRAMSAKKEYLKQGYLDHPIWDRLVFRKVKAKVGLDRVRLVATGSAPIAGHVLEFLRCLFGCPVVEGYGQTEVTCIATFTHPHDFSSGHVGQPAACSELCLMDVPDMDYLSSDRMHGEGDQAMACRGRGEICFRGPCSLLDYFKMPEKTAEAKDKEGWVHSGDIGLWTEDGKLKVIDRKKNIFKLSQGEYVAPEKIEQICVQSPWLGQVFVYGNSFNSMLVAIGVLDADKALKLARGLGLKEDVMLEDITKEAVVIEAVLESMKSLCKDNLLKGFEQPRAIFLETDPFTPENDILTPTFKLKRNVAQNKYQNQIDEMYHKLGDKVAGKTNLSQKN